MSIQFEIHSIPHILTENVVVESDDTAKIYKRLRKTNRKLAKKMKAIDRKEKRSWQKSRLRNSK